MPTVWFFPVISTIKRRRGALFPPLLSPLPVGGTHLVLVISSRCGKGKNERLAGHQREGSDTFQSYKEQHNNMYFPDFNQGTKLV